MPSMRRARPRAKRNVGKRRSATKSLRRSISGESCLPISPSWRPKTGETAFVEALLRVRQDDGGLVGPRSCFPVAEKLGLVTQLDQRVLELALDRLAAEPELRVAVNISVVTLRSPDWVDRVEGGTGEPSGNRRAADRRNRRDAGDRADRRRRAGRRAHEGARGRRSRWTISAPGTPRFAICAASNRHRQDRRRVRAEHRPLARRSVLRAHARRTGAPSRDQTVAEWVEDAETRRLLGEWQIDYLQGHFLGRAGNPRADAGRRAALCAWARRGAASQRQLFSLRVSRRRRISVELRFSSSMSALGAGVSAFGDAAGCAVAGEREQRGPAPG